jgi:hypothetical protein
MTPEERERMNVLVLLIQQEKDQDKFTKLVEELNKLISQKENRFPRIVPPFTAILTPPTSTRSLWPPPPYPK